MCLKYEFDQFGNAVRDRMNNLVPRLKLIPAECRRRSPKTFQLDTVCPKGTPEQSKALWPANELAYAHYRECRAVGSFPDDPIVRRNAGVIREIEDEFDRYCVKQSQETQLKVLSLILSRTEDPHQ